MRKILQPKDSDEVTNITFDFAAALDGETLTGSPVVVCTRDAGSGTDDSSTIINGAATIVGTTVVQSVKGGTAGFDYRIEVRAQTAVANRTLVLVAILPVRE